MQLNAIWKRLFVATFFICFLSSVCIGGYAGYLLGLPDGHNMVFESISPSGTGQAFFWQESSKDGKSTDLFIKDRGSHNGTPLWLGSIEVADGGVSMDEAIWSGDGTLIIVKQSYPRQMNQKTVKDSLKYVVYDFKFHRKLTSDVLPRIVKDRGGRGINCFQDGEWRTPRRSDREIIQQHGKSY